MKRRSWFLLGMAIGFLATVLFARHAIHTDSSEYEDPRWWGVGS